MIPVIDLFAGPGGLNEGFSSVGENEGNPAFRTAASFEMDPHAHQTLVLRGAFRILKRKGRVPDIYYQFVRGEVQWDAFTRDTNISDALEEAGAEVYQLELGPENRDEADGKIRAALSAALSAAPGNGNGDWVLIGGPPCQAYSLAGRSRRRNDKEFEEDKKHFLYREYLHIIREFAPAIFVMENVKGLLSSKNKGSKMFDLILGDLSSPREGLEYDVRSFVVPGDPASLEPTDFIIRAEKYGVPQRRHRVILLGIRKDLADRVTPLTLKKVPEVTVRSAIADLPKIRSGIVPVRDNSWDNWSEMRKSVRRRIDKVSKTSTGARTSAILSTGSQFIRAKGAPVPVTPYHQFIHDERMDGFTLHEARRHMTSDLERYGFLAHTALSLGRNPTLLDFPTDLLPAHENVGKPNTPFIDRFRVQLWDQPATTVVSHIAKDGHYYIHPDPEQMRSLTVREAARLQSFPDNYFFRGSRTHQYHQVGNAVPPFLARQIALLVAQMLGINSAEVGEVLENGESIRAGSGQDLEKSAALTF